MLARHLLIAIVVGALVLTMQDEMGSVTIPSVAGVDRMVLVVSQLHDGSHIPDDMDYNNARDFTCRVQLEPVVDGGFGDSGGQEDGSATQPSADGGASHSQSSPADDRSDGDGNGCTAVHPSWAAALLLLWLARVRRPTR